MKSIHVVMQGEIKIAFSNFAIYSRHGCWPNTWAHSSISAFMSYHHLGHPDKNLPFSRVYFAQSTNRYFSPRKQFDILCKSSVLNWVCKWIMKTLTNLRGHADWCLLLPSMRSRPFFAWHDTCILTFWTVGKIFSRRHIVIFLFFFFQEKKNFDISCKLSITEKICMKCLILFSAWNVKVWFLEKMRKSIINLLSAEFEQTTMHTWAAMWGNVPSDMCALRACATADVGRMKKLT